jgi:hypothetical protein
MFKSALKIFKSSTSSIQSEYQKGSGRICHFQSLMNSQNQNRFYNYGFQKKQKRKMIIQKIIFKFCKSLDFSKETLYKTIALFDSLISRYYLKDFGMRTLAIICLILIAKIREPRYFYLRILECAKKFKIDFKEKISQLEQKILFICNFKINLVSVNDFLEIFKNNPDLYRSEQFSTEEVTRNRFHLLVDIIQLKMTEFYELNKYTVIAVAICVLMLTRYLLNLSPLIPDFIRVITNCDENILLELYLFLKIHFVKNFKESNRIKTDFLF